MPKAQPEPVILADYAEVSRKATHEMADLFVAYLEQLGVEYVFGVPGGAIEPLYNALARSERRGGVRAVVARHEAGAAFMADGYWRQSGKLGVCCATTGPGATNMLTGVASAYDHGVPLLVITAQSAMANFARGALQDSSCAGIDIPAMFRLCTRYSTLVTHVEQFERKLVAAVMAALRQPLGPAHLSVPLDILRAATPLRRPSYDLSSLTRAAALSDDQSVEALWSRLVAAKQTVFVLGEGCTEGIAAILELAAALSAVVVTTPEGKGLISGFHPLYRGVFGIGGHAAARQAVASEQVDTVVAVGTALGEWASNGWDPRLLDQRLVHVAESETQFVRSAMASLHVRGRIATIFERLLLRHRVQSGTDLDLRARRRVPASRAVAERDEVRHFALDDEAAYVSPATPIKPQRLMHDLTRLFPPNTRYVVDSGNTLLWALHYLHPGERRRRGKRRGTGTPFASCLSFGAMGWALGAAVGSALGAPGDPVVCLVGDGSYLMNGQEITVALQQRLPIVFVVINDGALGMVKHGQRLAGAEPIGFELPAVDYCALARALGVPGYVVSSPEDLRSLDVRKLCQSAGPTLLDVRIDPGEVPPLGPRVKVLGSER
jgi:acetolactate synthase-1/2/3 large subunit